MSTRTKNLNRRRRSPARKRADSIHEAGHAVAALVLGADVLQVDIRFASRGRGHCFHGDLSSQQKELTVLWAGFMAELLDCVKYRGLKPRAARSVGGDHPAAEAIIVKMMGARWTRTRADRAHHSAMERAKKLLEANWSAVVDIAGRVQAKQRIGGQTVRAAVMMGRMVPRER